MINVAVMDLSTDGAPLGIEWRRTLKEVDEELDSKEVCAFCFLCRDHVPGARLEKVTRGLELLTELEHRGIISSTNNKFLVELLYRAGRLDLLRKFNYSAKSMREELDKIGTCFPPFRLLLQHFCDELTQEEVQTMKFLAASHVGRNKLQDASDAQSLFVILEKFEVLIPEDVLVLREMVSSLERRDLMDRVIEYEADRAGFPLPRRQLAVMVPQYPHQSFPLVGNKLSPPSVTPMTSYNDPPPPYTPCDGSLMGSSHSSPAHMKYPISSFISGFSDISIDDRALTPPIEVCKKSQLAEALEKEAKEMVKVRQIKRLQEIHISKFEKENKETTELDLQREAEQLKREFEIGRNEIRPEPLIERQPKPANNAPLNEIDEMPRYKMDAKPRGVCLIINNRDFYQMMGDPRSKTLPKREGTEIDCKNLDYIFKKIGFITEKFFNLTEVEIMRTLAHYAFKVNHAKFDCFVCCILTHGASGGLYGVNGKFVEIKDLTACFKAVKCPSLAGKPKLFFLQACQGRNRMKGIQNLETDAGCDLPPETIPNEADFMLGYATIPGFVSFRSRSMGSWYITKLVEMLDKYWDRYDLLSIMIKVNEEVSKAVAQVEDQTYKQTPAPMPTLRKKIFFM